ncbi:hypothetical protein KRR26_14590, partial [Corallococcus sp. M34]|nr:hypothetical protein [Citreicoccus inhibens]
MNFHTEGDHLVGMPAPNGPCGFDTRQTLLTGEFQGNIVMASLTVCQTGPRCSSAQTYPVLFVVNPEDGALSGTVRLQKGCTSPALPPVSSALPQTSLLVLKAAPRGAAPPPAEAPPAGAPAAAPAAPSGGDTKPTSS